MYKGFVFDLDGTLVHTKPEYRQRVVIATLESLGISGVAQRDIDTFWFRTGRDEIVRRDFGVQPGIFWRAFRRYDSIELRRRFTIPYPDTDIIPELRRKGYKMGVVTGAPPQIAELEIAMLGAENFDAVIIAGRSNGTKPKPHPEGLQKCLGLLGLKNTEAPFIGNSDEDILAARNAKMKEILVERGEYDFSYIVPAPSTIIKSLYELRSLLT